jgi:hypothetical protein
MKALFLNRQTVQQLSGEVAMAIDELVSANNVQPLEVGEAKIRSGLGSPEGRLLGNPGDLFLRTDGGIGSVLYLKGTGTNTKTGWITLWAFPAIQVPSTDPNTLDDYEEAGAGTVKGWTPSDGSGAGLAFTVNNATYTKIGRLVHVTGSVTYPATASGAGAIWAGLPFAASAEAGLYSYVNTTGAGILGYIPVGSTTIQLRDFAFAQKTNVQMTGATVAFTGSYPST